MLAAAVLWLCNSLAVGRHRALLAPQNSHIARSGGGFHRPPAGEFHFKHGGFAMPHGFDRRRLLAVALLVGSGAVGAQSPGHTSLNAQLLVAARQGDAARVRQLFDRGAAANARNRLGKTVLLIAAERGDAPMAESALRAGAAVDLAALDGVTPLMAASHGGHADLVRRLLAAGARTDPVDRMHKPAMVYAAGQGQAAVVALLLDRGVPVDAPHANQLTALMWAAGGGSATTVDLLLARGARTDLRDDRGLRAEDIAREAGHAAIAQRLARQP